MRQADMEKKNIFIYETDGKEPYTKWLKSLSMPIRARIMARMARVEVGNYGDCQPVGDRVSELRFHFGAGYRVYFGETSNTIVILLNGGTKRTQKKDIKIAKEYWKEYLSRSKK